MKNGTILFFSMLLSLSAFSQCSELFFSEYVEGSGNNKALEIFNPTANTINLVDYRIVRWVNGSTTADSNLTEVQPLSGTVPSNGTYVMVIDRQDPFGTGGSAPADSLLLDIPTNGNGGFYSPYGSSSQGANSMEFNGDDAISLEKFNGSTWDIVDIFGLIGERPENGLGNFGVGWTDVPPYWNGGGVYWTKDHSLVRKNGVLDGVTTNPGTPYTGAWNVATEWDSLPKDDFSSLGGHSCNCLPVPSSCNELFFSEYVEGSSHSKALEIYNPTALPIDLAPYALERYNNGDIAPSGGTMDLQGTIPAFGTYVIANGVVIPDINGAFCDPALQALADTLDSDTYPAVCFFNGNDAITLMKNNVMVDLIGEIGVNPGQGWPSSGTVYTYNQTIQRDSNVTEGITQNTTGFVTSEWGIQGLNYWSGLGNHSSICNPTTGSPCTNVTATANVSAAIHCVGDGGDVYVTSITMTPPFTYQWDSNAGSVTTQSAQNLAPGTYYVTVTDSLGCTASDFVTLQEADSFVVSFGTTQPACGQSNGSISLTVSGANPPYSYAWPGLTDTTSSVSGLAAGTYQAFITDNFGCLTSIQVPLTNPSGPTILNTETNVSCNGDCSGSITTSVSGGTMPYTYAWSPGGETTSSISNLCPNVYFFTVTDANGCESSSLSQITEPSTALSATSSVTDANCGANDGTITISASGGTAGYSYLWSNGLGTTATVTGLAQGSYAVTVSDAEGCTFVLLETVSSASTITSTGNEVNPSCGQADGSITVIPSGGSAPYTYNWSNGATTANNAAIAAGSYTVTIMDANQCTDITIYNLNSTAGPSIGSTVNDETCFGACNGSISLSVTGGTSPYTYSWNNGSIVPNPTGLCQGLFDVTVFDASGCQATDNYSIQGPPEIVLVITPSDPACGQSNGSATVSASGGVSPYSYAWSPVTGTGPVLSGIAAGTYTVVVTDGDGCAVSGSTSLSDVSGPSVSMITVNESCSGACDGAVTANATGGGGGYSYQWSVAGVTNSIATNLCSGNIAVTVTDANSCQGVANTTVEADGGVVSASFQSDSIVDLGQGGTIQFINNSLGGLSYQWSFGDGNLSTSINPLYTYSSTGIYTITLVATNGQCTDTASMQIQVISTGIAEGQRMTVGMHLAPNPTSGTFAIRFQSPQQVENLLVIDGTGKVVKQVRFEGQTKNFISMSLDDQAAGIYSIMVQTKNGWGTQRISLSH